MYHVLLVYYDVFFFFALSLDMKAEEFAEYGNLKESSSHHSVERLCKFTIQAAAALEYLEKKKIVHQTLSSHCMVAAGYQVKSSGRLEHKILV